MTQSTRCVRSAMVSRIRSTSYCHAIILKNKDVISSRVSFLYCTHSDFLAFQILFLQDFLRFIFSFYSSSLSFSSWNSFPYLLPIILSYFFLFILLAFHCLLTFVFLLFSSFLSFLLRFHCLFFCFSLCFPFRPIFFSFNIFFVSSSLFILLLFPSPLGTLFLSTTNYFLLLFPVYPSCLSLPVNLRLPSLFFFSFFPSPLSLLILLLLSLLPFPPHLLFLQDLLRFFNLFIFSNYFFSSFFFFSFLLLLLHLLYLRFFPLFLSSFI